MTSWSAGWTGSRKTSYRLEAAFAFSVIAYQSPAAIQLPLATQPSPTQATLDWREKIRRIAEPYTTG